MHLSLNRDPVQGSASALDARAVKVDIVDMAGGAKKYYQTEER